MVDCLKAYINASDFQTVQRSVKDRHMVTQVRKTIVAL